jgi:hypothetical protein
MKAPVQVAFSLLTILPLLVAVSITGAAGDAARIAGYLFGFSIGALIEDRYVGFGTEVTLTTKIIRIFIAGVIGGAALGALSVAIPGADLSSVFVSSVLQGLTIVVIIPVFFKIFERKSKP